MPKKTFFLNRGKFSVLLTWVAVTLLVCFFSTNYISLANTRAFQVDEFEFIRKSFFLDLFLQSNFNHHAWYIISNDPAQPKVGPYIYGISLKLTGYHSVPQYFENYNQLKTENPQTWWKIVWSGVNKLPEEINNLAPLIRVGRYTSATFGVFTLLMVFLVAKLTKSTAYGLVAMILLGNNALFRNHVVPAMTDSFLLFFMTVALLLLILLSRVYKSKNNQFYLLAISLGVVSALAAGSKVTGILTLILIITMQLILLIDNRRKKIFIKLIFGLGISLTTFLITFISLHPLLYRDPLTRIVYMFANRLDAANEYQYIEPFAKSAVTNRWRATKLVLEKTLLPGGHGNFRSKVVPYDLFFFAIGVLFIFRKIAFEPKKTGKYIPEKILLLWAVIIIFGLIIYLRNDWPRYYLPSIVIITMIEAYGIQNLLFLSWRELNKLILKIKTNHKSDTI